MTTSPDLRKFALRFFRGLPAGVQGTIRILHETSTVTSVRGGVTEPVSRSNDLGAMVTVADDDGIGYAATPDLSESGIATATLRALHWARTVKHRSVFEGRAPSIGFAERFDGAKGFGPELSVSESLDKMHEEAARCKVDARIVDWQASLWTVRSTQLISSSEGGEIVEDHEYAMPSLYVVASDKGLTQMRSWGGRYNGLCQQGDAGSVIARSGFEGAGHRTAEEALQLLAAPNCPSGTYDVVLMPDQMMLQIHESIGHPLELDRILGDERNYAGTSFVTPQMFGTYQYGSPLLNVTFDPSRSEEFASFSFDDDGTLARKQYLIKDGILVKPLGGALSHQRAMDLSGIGPVATTRASGWNRPAIDRMSNLNIEAGTATLEEMVASVEDGILMQTNASFSIDDSRNKFQFGCEWGQRIRKGKLAEVVRNPNYRGVSSTFWRSLDMVGNETTVEVMGTPYCGKGEPNQIVRVGHSSPACKFRGASVFGAEQ